MAASRTPSLGPSPLFSPPSAQLLLWPWVQSLWDCSEDSDGPQAGVTWVSQEPSLRGWKPSFPRALLSSGAPPRCLLLSVSPHHPASAFLSSHSLWNQLQQYRQNRAPPPQGMQFMPLCLHSCCFFIMECLYPAPPALSAWQTPIHLSQSPSKAPSSRKTTPVPLPLQATSPLCKCFGCGTYHTVF